MIQRKTLFNIGAIIVAAGVVWAILVFKKTRPEERTVFLPTDMKRSEETMMMDEESIPQPTVSLPAQEASPTPLSASVSLEFNPQYQERAIRAEIARLEEEIRTKQEKKKQQLEQQRILREQYINTMEGQVAELDLLVHSQLRQILSASPDEDTSSRIEALESAIKEFQRLRPVLEGEDRSISKEIDERFWKLRDLASELGIPENRTNPEIRDGLEKAIEGELGNLNSELVKLKAMTK